MAVETKLVVAMGHVEKAADDKLGALRLSVQEERREGTSGGWGGVGWGAGSELRLEASGGLRRSYVLQER